VAQETHVVMMVANDISNDSRVLKEAVAIARTGVRVTLLGVSPDGKLSMDCLDGNTVMARLPGAFPLREERKRRRGKRRARRLPVLGYKLNVEPAARKTRIAARLADVKAESGQAAADRRAGKAGVAHYKTGVVSRGLKQQLLRFADQRVQVRGALTRRENKWFISSWAWWDDKVSQVERPVSWRRVVPEAYDYEQIFGKVLDELAPDVLHAHDMHLIGVASRAAGRAKLRGREMKMIYDAHEYVPGLSRYGGRTPRFIAAWAQHEREYIGTADRVITVSPAIARTLQRRYKLDREPDLIMNTPSRTDLSAEVVDLRTRTGLADDVPLMVYSGGVTKARGVETAVQALPHLPGVHLAVVCVPSTEIGPVRELRKLAASLQVEDRVHYLNPVGPDEVVSFLRTADIGLIPILRYPSHEMALPNKVFEYVFAGLPVVTSDMPSLTEFVQRTGIGEAFEAENPVDLAAKVTRVLADPAPYRQQAGQPDLQQEVSWEGQAANLRKLYGELLGRELTLETPPAVTQQALIGPTNTDGQATELARAIERNQPSFKAQSFRVGSDETFPADLTVASTQYKLDIGWRVEFADELLEKFSHVLFERGLPILGNGAVQWLGKDLPLLETAGIKHAVVFYGPEIRDPSRHSAVYPHSPFADKQDPATAKLQIATDLMQQHLAEYDGPRFVLTPDLLEYVENSQWLPIAVELDEQAATSPLLEREVPVVLSANGSAPVEAVLTELADRGLIEYQRVGTVPHAELVAKVRDADIVVEELLLGSYGVLACEAMAAGRIVVGHVAKHVRAQLPTELPIVEATPDDLGDVIERLITDRATARHSATAGPRYVRDLHDGRKTVEALQPFLGS
jgi:glycosyltransferase involved in cell wall biosynthesis